MTVPRSRVRNKAVYTPPRRTAKSKASPPWLAPAMVTCLVVGLAWIATFYISNQALPVRAMGSWNLVIGFALIIAGVAASTRWR